MLLKTSAGVVEATNAGTWRTAGFHAESNSRMKALTAAVSHDRPEYSKRRDKPLIREDDVPSG